MEIWVGTDVGPFVISEQGVEARWAGTAVTGLAGRWALTGRGQLVDIVDGTTAAQISDGRARCLGATEQTVLVGTAGAHVLALGSSGLSTIASFDAVEGRDHWYTPWGAPPDTRSIAIDPAGRWFVNVHVGGVWRTRDGEQWELAVPVDDDTHQVVAGDRWVVAAAAVGVGVSDDGGVNFRWSHAGMHGSYCRAVAVAGDVVLATASTGPGSRRGAVYRRPLASDEPFARCDAGLAEWFPGNIDTFQLAADGTAVAVGTDQGDVYSSDDAGATWRARAAGLSRVRCLSVFADQRPG